MKVVRDFSDAISYAQEYYDDMDKELGHANERIEELEEQVKELEGELAVLRAEAEGRT